MQAAVETIIKTISSKFSFAVQQEGQEEGWEGCGGLVLSIKLKLMLIVGGLVQLFF